MRQHADTSRPTRQPGPPAGRSGAPVGTDAVSPTGPAIARLRVDHVGSLLRPKTLKDAFNAYAKGELSYDRLTTAQDEAIAMVIAREETLGLPVLTDGEFRRVNWQVSFSQVHGWDQWTPAWKAFGANASGRAATERPLTRGEDAVVSFRTPATARLRLLDSFPLREFQFAAARATGGVVKATIMGPDRVAQMCDLARSPDYATLDQLMDDVVAVQREMVAGLLGAGCTYVQLDEPSYTGYVDAPTRKRMRAAGHDPEARLERAIAATNGVMAGFQDRATFAVHICRGNRASMWHREGAYDAIAERLFGGLSCRRLLLEYDSERAGGFAPLRYVSSDKTVVLGLITTKSGGLESVDELLARIDEAAGYLPVEQLAISPQCGFASGLAGNDVREDEQWRKLERMLHVAQRVWGHLP